LQLEAKVKNTDPWLLAPFLLTLICTTVACAEEAQLAKDGVRSRAHLVEAREAGQKFLRLVRSARTSPDRDVAVSESNTINECKCCEITDLPC
jgi:hypothetical protein